jgi:hypothetical protein
MIFIQEEEADFCFEAFKLDTDMFLTVCNRFNSYLESSGDGEPNKPQCVRSS